jgi:parvulin-like peptidyl-prolyl isomerase
LLAKPTISDFPTQFSDGSSATDNAPKYLKLIHFSTATFFMNQIFNFLDKAYAPIDPYVQDFWLVSKPHVERFWELIKPYVIILARPIIGPINGFHFLMFAAFLVQHFLPSKGPKVHVKHILAKSEENILKLKKRIVEEGETFEAMAKYSTCPSRLSFGDLGYISKGN